MHENLLIDIGNTMVKYAVFQGGNMIKTSSSENFDLDIISGLLEEYPSIKRGMYSDVRGVFEAMMPQKSSKFSWIKLNKELKMPFINRYDSPESLGTDRMALAAAALTLFAGIPTLIISAGTCITYDFVDDERNYRGGAISPGLQMRLKAMHGFTGKLPLLQLNHFQTDAPYIGKTTKDSMLSGVLNGVIGEIEYFISRYKQEWPDLKIILTGGDQLILDKMILSSIFAHPNLVLVGMNHILELNAK